MDNFTKQFHLNYPYDFVLTIASQYVLTQNFEINYLRN